MEQFALETGRNPWLPYNTTKFERILFITLPAVLTLKMRLLLYDQRNELVLEKNIRWRLGLVNDATSSQFVLIVASNGHVQHLLLQIIMSVFSGCK